LCAASNGSSQGKNEAFQAGDAAFAGRFVLHLKEYDVYSRIFLSQTALFRAKQERSALMPTSKEVRSSCNAPLHTYNASMYPYNASL
jgi:hypothetical protein